MTTAAEAMLLWCERKREEILAQAFTPELSRELENIDELEETIWKAVHADA
jgi:hypothetical protein